MTRPRLLINIILLKQFALEVWVSIDSVKLSYTNLKSLLDWRDSFVSQVSKWFIRDLF